MDSFMPIGIQSRTVLIINLWKLRFVFDYVFDDRRRRFSYDNFCFSEEQSRRYSTKRLDMLKDHGLNLLLDMRNIDWI